LLPQIIKNYEFQLITQQTREEFAGKQNGDFSSVKVNSIKDISTYQVDNMSGAKVKRE